MKHPYVKCLAFNTCNKFSLYTVFVISFLLLDNCPKIRLSSCYCSTYKPSQLPNQLRVSLHHCGPPLAPVTTLYEDPPITAPLAMNLCHLKWSPLSER